MSKETDKTPIDKRPVSWYPHTSDIQTRWMDNDVYGHVNNVVYYSYFDTAVNSYLIDAGALDIHHGAVIGLVVETSCSYFAPIEFPEQIVAGIAVTKIGKSSVRYEIGLCYKKGEEHPVAQGYFVHVYVDRESRKSTALPDAYIHALNNILKVQKQD